MTSKENQNDLNASMKHGHDNRVLVEKVEQLIALRTSVISSTKISGFRMRMWSEST